MKNYKKHIVIIGGGFGGISAANELKGKDVDITLIDKTNHHLFQPLLYQVATAALSPGDIATPIRSIIGKDSGVRVILGEVEKIGAAERKLTLLDGRIISYDQLIIAVGAKYNYFGHNEWEDNAPGLKSISDALQIRERILLSLEEAEQIPDPKQRKPYLTYVIIGGGPTGVEMAGAIAEITKRNIKLDYSNISKEEIRIVLVEAAPGILNGYPEPLSLKAKEMLEELGVEVMLNKPVTKIERGKISFADGAIESPNIIWAAGVVANPLINSLGVAHDRSGRVMVNGDLSLPDYPEIFVIGDAAHYKDEGGKPLPSTASVAMQQGQFVGKALRSEKQMDRAPFRYANKGSMATIGRAKAVADIKGLKLSGFPAWILWSVVHILFLIGFRNRFRVFVEWVWYYFTYKRGVRLITDRSGCQHCSSFEKPLEQRDKIRKVLYSELQLQA